jgi:hypothetical protein
MFFAKISIFCFAAMSLANERPRRHKRRTKDEVEKGLSKLRNHITRFRADATDILLGDEPARKKKEETQDIKEEIHELRSTFDMLDKDAQENLISSRLAFDLSGAFQAPLSREEARATRRKHRAAAAKHHYHHPVSKAFDRSHWEELKDVFQRSDLKRSDAEIKAEQKNLKKKSQRHKKKHHWNSKHRHPKRQFKEMSDIPMVVGNEKCGAKIPISQLGLRAGDMLQDAYPSLLQSGFDPSYARLGSGLDQKAVDNGMSTMGSLDGVEPFVSVFKDGYFLTGCVADAMFLYGDKYGDNKFQYRDPSSTNVSILLYNQMVLKEEQVAMSPEVCFDFCRTMPDMVYFGLIYGRDCYCTPYWKPSAEGAGACDLPCPGSASEMCGGDSKSSMYEMHLCADTANDLQAASESTGHVLQYFFENADQLKFYDQECLKSGQKLMSVAGAGGDPVAADLGMMANKASGIAAKLLVDGTCTDAYSELLAVYNEAQSTKDLDFSNAADLEKADTAIQKMKELSPIAEGCAKKAEDFNVKTYPWFVEYAESLSSDDPGAWWDDHLKATAKATQLYKPLAFVIESTTPAKLSTCGGEVIGHPMLMHYQECAEACDMTVYPESCVGFQHFGFGSGGSEKELCFMFKSFKSMATWTCDFLSYDEKFWKASAFLQTRQRQSFRSSDGNVNCDAVGEALFFRGMVCTAAEKDSCGDLCDKAKGATLSASCNVKIAALSGALPNIKLKKNKRCFAADENSEDSGEITLDALNEFGGTSTFGGTDIEEPTLWTE